MSAGTTPAQALSHIGESLTLSAAFVRNNIDEFFELESELEVSDNLRELLLEADITDESRLKILRLMDLSLLAGMPARVALVGRILARTRVAIEEPGADAARAVILSSHPLEAQISQFNMLHERLDDEDARGVLQALPRPMADIRSGWNAPKMEGSEVNPALGTWLQARGFISSPPLSRDQR